MSRYNQVGKVATKVTEENGVTKIRYHATDVVTFDAKKIILNHGGWMSATTKVRMNQAAIQFGLGYSVAQKKGAWEVTYKGTTYEFSGDRLTLDRQGSALEKAG